MCALVRLAGLVGTQTLNHVQRMRHGFDAAGIDAVHLGDQSEDVGEIGRITRALFGGDREPGEVGDLIDIGTVQ